MSFNIPVKNFNAIYDSLVEMLLENSNETSTTYEKTLFNFAIRTENKVQVLDSQYKNTSFDYIVAETDWYLSGSNLTEDIAKHAPFWKEISDDGIHSNSAYGHILMNKYEIDQVNWAINELKQFPESRRAVVHIRTPQDLSHTTKDTPCTLTIQFMIRKNKLQMMVNMRSNDINFGLPYDFFFFNLLQKLIANELGIETGIYYHTANSMHLYKKDVDNAIKVPRGKKEQTAFSIYIEIPSEFTWTSVKADRTKLIDYLRKEGETYAKERKFKY